jgi:hypothetical protein
VPDSSIAVDFNQRWSYYPAGGPDNTSYSISYYDFIARYVWHPVARLTWSAEAGYQLRRGNGFDEDLFVARTYLKWLLGRLDLHLGYEFQDQKYVIDERQRHFVFLRARRNF